MNVNDLDSLVEGQFDEDVLGFGEELMNSVDNEIESLLEAEDDLKVSQDHDLLDLFLPLDL